MSLKISTLAAALDLSGALPSCGAPSPLPEPNLQPEQCSPTVLIAPAGSSDRRAVESSAAPYDYKIRRHKPLSAIDNPILLQQQRLWECVLQVDAFLFMNCLEEIGQSADCYNAGLDKIVDANREYPQCLESIRLQAQGGEKYEIAQNKCLDEVLRNKPQKLRPLDQCFTPQISCFETLIKNSSIICNAEDQDAR